MSNAKQQRKAARKVQRRREKVAVFITEARKITDAGNNLVCLDEATGHYRAINPQGGQLEIWASTHNWLCRFDYSIRGQGVDTMLVTLPGIRSPEPERHEAPEPIVTVFADGSWCPKTHAAGWGCWIKADDMPSITSGGSIEELLANNLEAEVRALANAVALALLRRVLKPGGVLSLQSDCLAILSALMKEVPSISTSRAPKHSSDVVPAKRLTKTLQESVGMHTLIDLIVTNQLKVHVRHVKGHRSGSGRAWVNNQCDKIAYEGMDRRRAQIHGRKKTA